MNERLPRRPHYACDHRTTQCRDCDGSPPASTPWRVFLVSAAPTVSGSPEESAAATSAAPIHNNPSPETRIL